MNVLKADFDSWHIEYCPDDGARITALKYGGLDLLTPFPSGFRPPDSSSGEYETRPVYGYDDCFPTVDPCRYPLEDFMCRDHGELCWEKWQAEARGRLLVFSTGCMKPAVTFRRILDFGTDRITWRFEVSSLSDKKCVFLHVMHAFLSPDGISNIQIPGCRRILDEINFQEPGLKSSAGLGEHLLAFQPGSFSMLLLRDIEEGFVALRLRNGLKLEIGFDAALFPTLGIWWNKGGYPAGGLAQERMRI